MAIVIAGERSGVGKTTVTLAMLASLRRRPVKIQSFKVGPDYIDPMFHRAMTQQPCRTLDPILTSKAYVCQCFATHAVKADYSLVEGVMGLFDGVCGTRDEGSTAHVARLLNLPIALVLDCSRISRSVAAIAHGYRTYDPRLQIAGVILNRVGSDRHLTLLQDALDSLQMPILGVLHRHDGITIPDRHLGLVPTDELPQLPQLFEQLADLGDRSFDWPKLLPLLKTDLASPSPVPSLKIPKERVLIAIARDAAFNFYYEDNLEQLSQSGADLIEWSPLQDAPLPSGIKGLCLGGGFPELFSSQLGQNQQAKQSVYHAIQAGLPTYAECGGLMYLCEMLVNLKGQSHPMVGVLPTQVAMQPKLTLGYRQAIAQQDTSLLPKGTILQGHEFHHSDITQRPNSSIYALSAYNGTAIPYATEGWRYHQVHASYLHLHWGDRPELPQRFVKACLNWSGLPY